MKSYHPDPKRSPPVYYLGRPGAPGYAISEGWMDPQQGVETQLGREFLTPPWDPSLPLLIVAEIWPPDRANPAIWFAYARPPSNGNRTWDVRVVHEQPPRSSRRRLYIDELKINVEVGKKGTSTWAQLAVSGATANGRSNRTAREFRCRITLLGVFGRFDESSG